MGDTCNWYEVLRIKSDATPEEIKQAYRAAILRYHPDKQQTRSGDAPGIYNEVQQAWEVK